MATARTSRGRESHQPTRRATGSASSAAFAPNSSHTRWRRRCRPARPRRPGDGRRPPPPTPVRGRRSRRRRLPAPVRLLGDLVGHLPEPGLIDAGQDGDPFLHRGSALEVACLSTRRRASSPRGTPQLAGEVGPSARSGEGRGDVGGLVDVHHQRRLPGWSEDRQVSFVVGGDLEAEPGRPVPMAVTSACTRLRRSAGSSPLITVKRSCRSSRKALPSDSSTTREPHRSFLDRWRRGLEDGPGWSWGGSSPRGIVVALCLAPC